MTNEEKLKGRREDLIVASAKLEEIKTKVGNCFVAVEESRHIFQSNKEALSYAKYQLKQVLVAHKIIADDIALLELDA